jgi:uncharacterized membrane protein YcgQ (UPF0703/DUF1980 family)
MKQREYGDLVNKTDLYKRKVEHTFDSYSWLKKNEVLTDERYMDISSVVYDKYRDFLADNIKFREFFDSILGATAFDIL